MLRWQSRNLRFMSGNANKLLGNKKSALTRAKARLCWRFPLMLSLVRYVFIPEEHTETRTCMSKSFITSRMQGEGNIWFLLHDSAPAHWLLVARKYLAKHTVMALEHLPCSPDLSSPYSYFSKLLKCI
jgi:hypothetical protein